MVVEENGEERRDEEDSEGLGRLVRWGWVRVEADEMLLRRDEGGVGVEGRG